MDEDDFVFDEQVFAAFWDEYLAFRYAVALVAQETRHKFARHHRERLVKRQVACLTYDAKESSMNHNSKRNEAAKAKTTNHKLVVEALRCSAWPTKAQRKARATAPARPDRLQFDRRTIRTMHRQELQDCGQAHPRTTEPGQPTEWLLSQRLIAKQKEVVRLVNKGVDRMDALKFVFGIDVVANTMAKAKEAA